MSTPFNVFNPVECVKQGKVLAQKEQEAADAVKVAESAVEDARRKQEAADTAADAAKDEVRRQELVLGAMNDAYEAAGRMYKKHFPGGNVVMIARQSFGAQTDTEDAVCWPLTDDGMYMFICTMKREMLIGKKDTDGSIMLVPTDDFVNLAADILHDISRHLTELGAEQSHHPAVAEVSNGHSRPDGDQYSSLGYDTPADSRRDDDESPADYLDGEVSVDSENSLEIRREPQRYDIH